MYWLFHSVKEPLGWAGATAGGLANAAIEGVKGGLKGLKQGGVGGALRGLTGGVADGANKGFAKVFGTLNSEHCRHK